MAGPGDALFMALAQAKAQPDRWARDVNAGAKAGTDILGGYMQGKGLGQELDKYKLLNTPLGQIFPNPRDIPGGLTPDHKVSDLMNLTPVLPYIPTEAGGQILTSMAGGNPSPSASPAPMGGTLNPVLPSGTQNLDAIQGTGAGTADNVPAGTPTAIVGSGPPALPPSPSISRASPMDLQKFGPMMNDIRQGRQFQEGQKNENERARLSREQQEKNFQEGQQNEKNRTMATETSKIAPSLTEAGTIQDDINALLPLFKGYSPVPFAGTILANITAKSGSSSFGTPTMQTGKQINQIVPALSAKVNYLLNKRFNSGEANMLQQQVVPNASDDEANARQKIGNLQRLTAVMQGGDEQALQMVASAIAGRPVSTMLPSSNTPTPNQTPPNSTTGDPMADAAIQRVQQSHLDPASKQARIQGIMAKARMKQPHG